MWWPFCKWRPVEIFRCQESIRDIIIYLHMKCRWNRTLLNLCGIVTVILKMATVRNCSMSGINSENHYLPTYQILMISDNVEFLRYCGGHFENGDRLKFFNVGNQFGISLSTHISNFDDIGQCWNFYCPFFIPYFGNHFENGRHLEILKTQNCSSNGDLSLCQILCLYHYTFRSYQH